MREDFFFCLKLFKYYMFFVVVCKFKGLSRIRIRVSKIMDPEHWKRLKVTWWWYRYVSVVSIGTKLPSNGTYMITSLRNVPAYTNIFQQNFFLFGVPTDIRSCSRYFKGVSRFFI